MELIPSKDGTPIACRRGGTGAALLLVHGTSGDHRTWLPLLPALERCFSVWTVDRRGRGGSGDADDYALAREAEDIAAVVDAIGGTVHVFGHSFGGLCALEAAPLTPNIGRLMLYEPSLSLAGSGWCADLDKRMQALLAANRREDVLLLFLRDIVKMPEDDIAVLQAGPGWTSQVAAAPTVYRELRAIDGYVFDAERFRSLTLPTTLLLGEKSPRRRRVVADTLLAALPGSRITLLPGQAHGAVRSAPALIVETAVWFLTADSL